MPNNRGEMNNRVVFNINNGIAQQEGNVVRDVLGEIRENAAERVQIARPRNVPGQVLSTVGIELESIGLTQGAVKNILYSIPSGLGNLFKVHRDGSAEINVYAMVSGGSRKNRVFAINAHTQAAEFYLKRNHDRQTYGYELISLPMEIDSAELVLRCLLPQLKSNGDFVSERCATHIHVGMARSLPMMQNLLKFGLWADELFFALSPMNENKFRGWSNNAIYARPLMNGPYFRRGDFHYQVLNWKSALKAENFNDFFASYGIDFNREAQKYHPARYFSINLYSLLVHGTIEFRHFNQCFDADLVTAIAKLCQMFVEIGITGRKSIINKLDVCDVFESHSTNYYMNKIDTMNSLSYQFEGRYKLTNFDIYALEKCISRYGGIGIRNQKVLSHINPERLAIESEIISRGELIRTSDNPVPDGHTDIHNIKYASIMNG